LSNSTKIIMDLIKKHNITKALLERECGLANGTITNWEKGRNKPSYGAIVKISKYFNVSESFLLGENDTYTNIASVTGNKNIINQGNPNNELKTHSETVLGEIESALLKITKKFSTKKKAALLLFAHELEKKDEDDL